MRIPDTAALISMDYAVTGRGVQQKTETAKIVYGYYDSLTASEVFDGGRSGLHPEFRFVMTELDYNGQTVLVRDGLRYSIYRTYRPNNGTIELYCEQKVGTNG